MTVDPNSGEPAPIQYAKPRDPTEMFPALPMLHSLPAQAICGLCGKGVRTSDQAYRNCRGGYQPSEGVFRADPNCPLHSMEWRNTVAAFYEAARLEGLYREGKLNRPDASKTEKP